MQTFLTKDLLTQYNEALKAQPRPHYFHEGPYQGGHAFYSYYMRDESTVVLDGPFYYQYSFVSPFGTVYLNEAKGCFKHDTKDGKWKYLDKGDRHEVCVTVDYVHGHVDGAVIYEELKEGTTPEQPVRTVLSFRCVYGKPTGVVEGLMNGRAFNVTLDAEVMTYDERQSFNHIVKVINRMLGTLRPFGPSTSSGTVGEIR